MCTTPFLSEPLSLVLVCTALTGTDASRSLARSNLTNDLISLIFILSIFGVRSQDLMQDPVLAADGFSYERAAIEDWFAKGHRTSPKTGAV